MFYSLLSRYINQPCSYRWSGVKQGDEIQFVFGNPIDKPEEYLIEEKEFSKAIMKLWTGFARNDILQNITGISVTNFTEEAPNIIELNAIKAGVKLLSESDKQKCNFWNELYNKVRVPIQCPNVIEKPKQKSKVAISNEIDDTPVAVMMKKSSLQVEEKQPITKRKERGLLHNTGTSVSKHEVPTPSIQSRMDHQPRSSYGPHQVAN